VAVAPDHIGVAVWETSATSVIRMVAVGPDVPKPRPRLTLTGGAKHQGDKVHVTAGGKVVLPDGVPRSVGCDGEVTVSIKRGADVLATNTVGVDDQCRFRAEKNVRRGKVGGADKLKLVARFSGNAALARTTKSLSVRVRG
jgi:hypothetical protein